MCDCKIDDIQIQLATLDQDLHSEYLAELVSLGHLCSTCKDIVKSSSDDIIVAELIEITVILQEYIRATQIIHNIKVNQYQGALVFDYPNIVFNIENHGLYYIAIKSKRLGSFSLTNPIYVAAGSTISIC